VSRVSTRRFGSLVACALLAAAVSATSAGARQLSAARATFNVSFEGSYTATASAPVSDCSGWVADPSQPEGFSIQFHTVTATATETASFHSTRPSRLSLAGPYGSFPLTPEGNRTGKTLIPIQRSSTLHAGDRPDGCDVGDSPTSPPPPAAKDCGSRSVHPGFAAGSVHGAAHNSSKVSILPGFSFLDPFQACGVPGGVVFNNFQQKATDAAIRAARPRVSRLFSGSKRIVEHGTATVHGVGTDKGSAATYTITLKVTLTRTKLSRARFG
jgi:hypothetical protein